MKYKRKLYTCYSIIPIVIYSTYVVKLILFSDKIFTEYKLIFIVI